MSIGLDNIGIGKFKLFRIDYVLYPKSGFKGDELVFGLKFLNIID
jgi:hypothetical protein